MEDEEGIGLVLARATELRLKINDCIEKATTYDNPSPGENQRPEKEESSENGVENPNSGDLASDEFEEEAVRLWHIGNALESLETQLSSLLDLRQRQQYEKQVALAQIDYSRKMLLDKLKEYKGKELEVIHEASAFAGEKVDYENDLLLPPYPSRPPHPLVLDDGYVLNLTLKQKPELNGLINVDSPAAASKRNRMEAETRNPIKGFGNFICSVAKVVVPLVGVVSILSFSGLGFDLKKTVIPTLRRSGSIWNPASREKEASVQCPPGKVLVVENGEARCFVKERVEIPFDSSVSSRDINYGYG